MNLKLWLAAVLLVTGCAVPSTPGDGRSITGQLSSELMAGLDNPGVVLRTSDGLQRVVHVSRTGEFTLVAPVGVSTRLAVVTTTATGVLREETTIRWPHVWTKLAPGGAIELGVVRRRGGSRTAVSREDDGVAVARDGGHPDDDGDDDEAGEDEGDDDEDCHVRGTEGEARLPYAAKIPLGARYRLTDSFREKGPVPASIVSVTMEGGSWRLAELRADATFTVTQADCDHAGNRSTGRDRVFVSWRNADGSTRTEHLDLRYCEGDSAPSALAVPASSPGSTSTQSCDEVEVCEDDEADDDSECDVDDEDAGVSEGSGSSGAQCTPMPTTPPTTPTGTGTVGTRCVVNADCAASLSCIQSVCTVPVIN